MEARGQLAWVGSLLPPCRFWGRNSVVRLGSKYIFLLSSLTGPILKKKERKKTNVVLHKFLKRFKLSTFTLRNIFITTTNTFFHNHLKDKNNPTRNFWNKWPILLNNDMVSHQPWAKSNFPCKFGFCLVQLSTQEQSPLLSETSCQVIQLVCARLQEGDLTHARKISNSTYASRAGALSSRSTVYGVISWKWSYNLSVSLKHIQNHNSVTWRLYRDCVVFYLNTQLHKNINKMIRGLFNELFHNNNGIL